MEEEDELFQLVDSCKLKLIRVQQRELRLMDEMGAGVLKRDWTVHMNRCRELAPFRAEKH